FCQQGQISASHHAVNVKFFGKFPNQRKGADPDGSRGTKKRELFHRWNACRYAVVNTAGKIRLSSRSSRPPWPGKRLPESLTPKARLIHDSKRSPICPRILSATDNTEISTQLIDSNSAKAASKPAMTAPTKQPHIPATVFPGLISGASLRAPKRRP